jgi:protein subunit release factor B
VRRERIERVERDVEHLAFVARCDDPEDLGDALVTVSLVNRTGQAQDAVQKLTLMYQALATRRRMTSELLAEFYSGAEDRVYLLVAGLGAYGLLKHESGLHQVDRRYKHRAVRSGREVIGEDRELLRVDVNPASEPSREFREKAKVRISVLKPVRKRLLKADLALKVFHEPSLRSVEIWTASPRDSATAHGLLILNSAVATSLTEGNGGIIRHYDLGIGPRVKDMRTGRVTTRVNRVLKGDLEPLLEVQSKAAEFS